MAIDTQTFLAKASYMTPAQVVTLIQSSGVSTFSGSAASAAQALMDGKFEAAIAVTAQDVQSVKVMRAAGGALVTAGLVAAPLAVAGVAIELFSTVAADVAKFFKSIQINFGPTGIQCHSVGWPARYFYTRDAANGNPFPKPTPLANGKDQFDPGTLSALVIPPLCQAFADLENCQQPGCIGCPPGGGYPNPNSMAPFAYMSNVLVGSLLNTWNNGAIGDWIDYFVPFVPSGPFVAMGWPGWNGGGVFQYDSNIASQSPTGQWRVPPPFILPGQAQYAFQPLSAVPVSVANPTTEWTVPYSTALNPTGWQVNPYTGPMPGYQWSRVKAKTGPFVAGTVGAKVIVGAGVLSVSALAAAALYAWKTGKSVSTVIELVGKMVPEV